MEKIIPFEKEIVMNDNINDITSIGVEHNLNIDKENKIVSGEFLISGEYRVTSESDYTLKFSETLPLFIEIDNKYDILDNSVSIDNFYYEIINNNIILVHIDLLINNLKEKEINLNEKETNLIGKGNDIMEENVMLEENNRCIEEENNEAKEETIKEELNINNIFNTNDSYETYKTYKVYIVREGDDLELICDKYNITKEELENYNNINEIKIGEKIIIPSNNEES